MYKISTLTGQEAVNRVLDATGDRADPNIRDRALRSLRSAMQKWNNKTFWDWARTYAPLTFSSGSAALPSDVRAIYNLKVDGRVCLYMNARAYELMTDNGQELWTIYGQPYIYDVAWHTSAESTSGWTVELQQPANSDSSGANLRYYRRLTMPTDTSGSTLDVPEDYEEGVLAWASYHYLLNHGGDPRSERTIMWKQAAEEALTDAVRANQNVPDENVILQPSNVSPGVIQWIYP